MSGQDDNWFLSCSKSAFIKLYAKCYCEGEMKVKDLYHNILEQLKLKLIEDDLCGFKNLIDFIDVIQNSKPIEEISLLDENPFLSTNLVILACLYGRVALLEYILEHLDKVSVSVGIELPKPQDTDGTLHNAFYYAIRTNNVKLVETLISKWPNNYFDQHQQLLDDVIATAYHELRVKNVPLSDEIRFFIEGKLLDLRFLCNSSEKFMDSNSSILNRIDVIIDNINILVPMNCVDEKFIYIAKFIAKNIFLLKRVLKSTYKEIPWEEIEFCLICFIISKTKNHKLNMFYSSTIPTQRIVNHLIFFSKKLIELKNTLNSINISELRKLPNTTRIKIVHDILQRNPQFEDLYNDFVIVRDVTSLDIINDYTEIASKVDTKTVEGQLVLLRALIIVGKHLKNTLTAPKLSKTSCELLLISLPKQTTNILKQIHNSLVHENSMELRTAIESTSPNFFANIKDDCDKIRIAIGDVISNYKNQWIRTFLKRIVNLKHVDELKDIFEMLQKVEIKEIFSVFSHNVNNVSKMEKLCKACEVLLKDHSLYQKINDMKDRYAVKMSKFNNLNFKMYLGDLKLMSVDPEYLKFDKNWLRERKFGAKQILDSMNEKEEYPDEIEAKVLMNLLITINLQAEDEIKAELMSLWVRLFHIIKLEPNNINFLTQFNDMLEECNFYNDECDSQEQNIAKYDNEILLKKKITQMNSCLSDNGLIGFHSTNISSYKSNRNLQIYLEMLLLDTLSILENTGTMCFNESFLLDGKIPSIFGRSMRNHLAHSNSLIDVICDDYLLILLLNCQIMVKERPVSFKNSIGKSTESHWIEKNLSCDLKLIDLQRKMFEVIENISLVELKECIHLGADVHGRDNDMKTTVHYAAKCSSIGILEFLISQNVKVNVCDIYGRNPLHISALCGSNPSATYFVRENLISINDTDSLIRAPLHLACAKGHRDIVLFLLENGADRYLKDFQGKSPLHKAIEHKQINVFKILLENDMTGAIHDITTGGFNLLHQAAQSGCLDIVQFLLVQKVNVNDKGDKNVSALHFAALNGYIDVVETLILAGADVNARSINGGTPLHNAVVAGHHQIVELLLSHGADVNVWYIECKTTPLHNAATEGEEKIVNMLLSKKANVNAVTHSLQTPLHNAAGSGHLNIIVCLLNAGADINAKDYAGYSALHIAIVKGHEDIVEILLSKGANKNATTGDGFTPLHLSAKRNNAKLLDFLIRHGVIETRDNAGRYPLHVAAQKGDVDAIDILVGNGSKVNVKDKYGSTPIFLAIMNGHFNATKYLLNAGAQLSIPDGDKMTPLTCAISNGHLDIVKLLLEQKPDLILECLSTCIALHLASGPANRHLIGVLLKYGANINGKDNDDGMTALCYSIKQNDKMTVEYLIKNGAKIQAGCNKAMYLAVYYGFRDIVEILLRCGANPNAKFSDNMTPLIVAVNKGHRSIVQLLIDNGAKISNDERDTPLHLAALFGHEEIMEILLRTGADPNVFNNIGDTPLHVAVSKASNVSIIEILLKNGSNIHLKNAFGQLPIQLAVENNCKDVVKVLLSQGLYDVNMKYDDDDCTLLHAACAKGFEEIVQFLTVMGAETHSRNKFGAEPIHLAAEEGFEDTVKLMLKSGCTINDNDSSNKTLLHYAAANGKLVKFLLSEGANVNASDSNGLTPLHIAASTQGTMSKKTVRTLLENGAVFDATDKSQRTPVTMAASKNVKKELSLCYDLLQSVKHNKCRDVEKILRSGAFADCRSSGGNTPLHFAAWKNFEKVVKTLLDHNASINVANDKGFTPLHYASKFSHLNTMKILLLNGAIFDVKSANNKSPLEMATDSNIIRIFKQMSKIFKCMEDNNVNVIHELNGIRDVELINLIMNAHNSRNETLIVAAMRVGFPFVDILKNLIQGEDASLIMKEAFNLMAQDNPHKALYMLLPVFEEKQKMLGEEHPVTLDVQDLVGKALYKMGSHEKALEMCKDLAKKQYKVFGQLSKAALLTENFIGLTLHRQERNQEAYEIYRRIVPKLEEIAGPDDDETLKVKVHMAAVLERLGRFEEAFNINQEAHKKFLEKHGEYDQATVSMLNNVAMSLTNLKKHDESLKVYEEVYEKKKKIFGIYHTSTMNTYHSIASVHFHMKNYSKAIEIWKDQLAIQKKTLNPDHEWNLRALQSIADVYMHQGQLISAYECYREIVVLCKGSHFAQAAVFKIELIKQLLQVQGDAATFNILQNHQETLIRASSRGDLGTVKEILKYGGNINGRDASGSTALHHASLNGHIEVVVTLLENGGDPTLITNKANTPLHLAVSKGFSNIASQLLKHTDPKKLVDFVNAQTNGTGTTALHIAAKFGLIDIIIMLLSNKAIYDIENYPNQTPLAISKDKNVQTLLKDIHTYFKAATKGHVQVIEQIKLRSTDEIKSIVGTLNRNKCSLLQVAIQNKQMQLANVLVQMMKMN